MKILTLIALLLLQACSSQRIKERPNFHSYDEGVQKEIEKFKLTAVSNYGGRFASEGFFTSFSGKEMREYMTEVSPETLSRVEKMKTKDNIQWGVLALWISTLFIKDSNGNVSPLSWVGAVGYLGYGFYLNVEREGIIEQYNESLQTKFIPTLGYNYGF